MNKLFLPIGMTILIGCASQKVGTTSKSGTGDTRTQQVEFLDENTYLLTEMAVDDAYGYDRADPVKVGGIKENSGPLNERRFLNALLGPNGEEIEYSRTGSCCPFKTPNGAFENMGMLDRYKVYWKGSNDTLYIFLNMYDKGDLKIPVGLTARK